MNIGLGAKDGYRVGVPAHDVARPRPAERRHDVGPAYGIVCGRQ